jgi:hypothetical protein
MGFDGHMKGPTDSGEFVVARCGRHVSRRYAFWSRIAWGTPLRERNGFLEVYIDGTWQSLRLFCPASRAEIGQYHADLYGTWRIPKEWVFNDFGHITCYYFKDIDKDLKLGSNEKIHSEFIRTTPVNEGQALQKKTIILDESHGCIHVAPQDIDDMNRKGYLAPGNELIVHRYSERAPITPRGIGKKPFEVHFYPGAKRFVAFGVR